MYISPVTVLEDFSLLLVSISLPFFHTLPHFVQSHSRLCQTPLIPRTAPENLRGGGGPGPQRALQVVLIGLRGPYVYFAAEDEIVVLWVDGRERVVEVDGAPVGVVRAVRGWFAFAVKVLDFQLISGLPKPKWGKEKGGLGSYPVLLVTGDDFVPALSNATNRVLRPPTLHDDIFSQP